MGGRAGGRRRGGGKVQAGGQAGERVALRRLLGCASLGAQLAAYEPEPNTRAEAWRSALIPPWPRRAAVAETMVQMECDYVTPSFFRELEKQYQAEQGMAGEAGTSEGQARLDQLASGERAGAGLGWGGAGGEYAATAPEVEDTGPRDLISNPAGRLELEACRGWAGAGVVWSEWRGGAGSWLERSGLA